MKLQGEVFRMSIAPEILEAAQNEDTRPARGGWAPGKEIEEVEE